MLASAACDQPDPTQQCGVAGICSELSMRLPSLINPAVTADVTGRNRKIASPRLITLQSLVEKRELQLLVVGMSSRGAWGRGKRNPTAAVKLQKMLKDVHS